VFVCVCVCVCMMQVSTIKTVGADIIISTQKMTSLQMKQNSGNLICLTAANNSLFVDDRRQRQCSYIDSNAVARRSNAGVAGRGTGGGIGGGSGGKEGMEGEAGKAYYSSLDPMWREERARKGAGREGMRRNHRNDTIPQFGPLDMCPDGVTKKKDVVFIPQCTDTTLCKQSDSELCLCKPTCDLVEPEDLFYDGQRGVKGECDVSGRCCRLITREFSTADLFPKADQPRDGAAKDPILFPWTPNQLEQRLRLSSETGQIAVTALAELTSQFRVSSYKLEPPQERIQQQVNIARETKDLLDTLFHPSGAKRPKEVIYEFSTLGPGMTERQEGSFLWVASMAYMVLQAALLDTLSLGLIKPFQSMVEVRFNPSFCPAHIRTDDFAEIDRRLVETRKLLVDTLEGHPPNAARKPLPRESAIVFRPTADKPKLFVLDPKTNQIVVDLMYVEAYTLIWASTYFALALALLASLVIVGQMSYNLRAHLHQYRTNRSKEEQIFRSLPILMKEQKDLLAQKRHHPDKPVAQISLKSSIETDAEVFAQENEILGFTDFMFVLEDFLACPFKESTMTLRVSWVITTLAVLASPLIIIWVFASHWKTAVLEESCKVRADRNACLAQSETISSMAVVIIIVAIIIFAIELSGHYLRLSYSGVRPYCRKLFYIVYALVGTLALGIIILVCLWILIGTLLLPSKVAPYLAGLAGMAGNSATIWARLACLQHRVSRAVSQRVACMRPSFTKIPKPLLDVVIRNKLSEVLKAEGLSAPLMVIALIRQMFLLILLFVFVFIAFAAFSDVYDLMTGIYNACAVAFISVAFNNQIRTDSNSTAVKDQVHEIQERLSQQMLVQLRHVQFQIQGGMTLFQRMRDIHRETKMTENGSELSEMSDSESFLSTEGSEEEIEMPARADSPDAAEDINAATLIKKRLKMMIEDNTNSDGSSGPKDNSDSDGFEAKSDSD